MQDVIRWLKATLKFMGRRRVTRAAQKLISANNAFWRREDDASAAHARTRAPSCWWNPTHTRF